MGLYILRCHGFRLRAQFCQIDSCCCVRKPNFELLVYPHLCYLNGIRKQNYDFRMELWITTESGYYGQTR